MKKTVPITGRAWFVFYPGTIEDLRRPHPAAKERPFEVVRRVVVSKMEYENFTTDFYADRLFIEENAAACSKGPVYRCILVQRRGGEDGVLVMPYDECYVDSAAYWPGFGACSRFSKK